MIFSSSVFLLLAYLLAGGVFLLAFKESFFLRCFALWMAVTAFFLFSPNPLIFFIGLGLVCLLESGRRPVERAAMFLFLLPAVHLSYGMEIPGGVPGIRYWFFLNHARALILFVLLPLFLQILFSSSGETFKNRFFSLPTDKYVLLYFLVVAGLSFRVPSATEGLRKAFLVGIELLVPYYVFSRCARSGQEIRIFARSFLFAAVLLGAAGLLEELNAWNIFRHAEDLGVWGSLLFRGLFLRIETSFAQPLHFAFFLTLGISALVLLWTEIKGKNIFIGRVFRTELVVALFFTFSRGPWLGVTLFLILWVLLLNIKKSIKTSPFFMGGIILIGGLGLSMLLFAPKMGSRNTAEKVLMSEDGEHKKSIYYRIILWDASFKVITKNPWLGSVHFLEEKEMKPLARPENGLIDIASAYLEVVLNYGLIGLFLFLGIFSSALFQSLKTCCAPGYPFSEARENAAEFVFCALWMVLLMLITVSSFSGMSYVSLYCWILAGLGAACAGWRFPENHLATKRANE